MKYGFIGCGNMGGALATALSKATKDIMLCDLNAKKAEELSASLCVKCGSANDVVNNCERIFLGIKPQYLESALKPLKNLFAEKKPTVITMAAGVKISKFKEYLGGEFPIIRIMPNTPVLVGKGVILYCNNELVSQKTVDDFVNDMRFGGIVDALDEKLIDAGCSLSGCGPAFFYMFIQSLADGAVACGLPREKALKYAATTVSGAAETVLSTGIHPEILKDNVCSPAGSTIEGVKVLEDSSFRAATINAVKAAYKRNTELGK